MKPHLWKPTLETRKLVKLLRKEFKLVRHRAVISVSRGDYETLLKLAERYLK